MRTNEMIRLVLGLVLLTVATAPASRAEEFVIGFEESEGYSPTGGDTFGNGNLIGQPSAGKRVWMGSQGWGKPGCSVLRVVREESQCARLFLESMPPNFPIYFMEVPAGVVTGARFKFAFKIRYEGEESTGSQRDALFRIGLDSNTSGKSSIVRLEFLGNRRLNISDGESKSVLAKIGDQEWAAPASRWLNFVLTLYPDRGMYEVAVNGRQLRQPDGSDWKLPEGGLSSSSLYISLRGLRNADRTPPALSIDDIAITTP